MEFFTEGSFMPHGYCLKWEPMLLFVFVSGNILVFLSYFSIPGALALFVKRRSDLVFPWMFTLFATFIFLCGITHLVKVWTIWHAHYWLEASLDLLTGIVSLTTAILLWKLLPEAVGLPSPSQYRKANESLSKLAAIVECSEDGIVGINQDGNITTWNKGATRLYGYETEEVLGRPYSILTPDNNRELFQKVMTSIDSKQLEHHYETSHLTKSGNLVEVAVTVSSVESSKGELIGVSFIARNITEKREAENKVKLARDQAIEAAKIKSEFLASMSHEIRTPLNAVIGLSDLLGRSNLTNEQKDMASTIVSSGNILLDLINNILDYSRLDAEKLQLEMVEFHPVTIIEESAEILAGEARKKGISLMTYVDSDLPDVVRGDAGRIRQILLNLISNAIKFTEDGEVIVKANLKSKTTDMVEIVISITDTGIGIDENEAQDIFLPFRQANEKVSRIHGGSGLGLSISQQLVKLMKGEIGVTGSRAKGSRFWFSLPLEVVEKKDPEKSAPELSTMTAILVDGPDGSTQVLKDYLTAWGLSCYTVTNWQEYKQSVQNGFYTFTFVDHSIENSMESAYLDLVKGTDSIPVMITSSNDENLGTAAINAGYYACLLRPIKQSQLFDCLANLANSNSSILNEDEYNRVPDFVKLTPTIDSRMILVVEDNAVNQKVALLQLRELGYAAHAVGNGKEALAATETTSYSLILLDCQMPIMDGYQTTRAIRKREARTGQHTPIVAMTAHAMKGDREQCIASGMDDYISKPVNQEKLKQITDKWLKTPDQKEPDSDKPEPTSLDRGSPILLATAIEISLLEKTYGKEAMEEIVNSFLIHAEKSLKLLKQAINNKDSSISFLLHDLKGMSSSIFATSLSRLFYQLECKTQEDSINWPEIGQCLPEIQDQIENIKIEAQKFQNSQ